MDKKIVFIIGAGATYGDALISTSHKKPPLDRKFFSNARNTHPKDTSTIAKFIEEAFNFDIFKEKDDSLEYIMVMLYSDIYHPRFGDKTFQIFRKLIKLYNSRLAETTNRVLPSYKRNLFKLIAYHVEEIKNIENITFITFNQDIHIERILSKFEKIKKYSRYGKFLNFPYCYDLEDQYLNITSPKHSSVNLFTEDTKRFPSPKIYKLHGSLSWFSTHNSSNISKNQIFNPKRRFYITCRAELSSSLTISRNKRKVHTFPIIVPPVLHKSRILHAALHNLWTKAEKILSEANEIVIFGYSCPETDVESVNLVRRSIKGNKNLEGFSVVDPNHEVANRYLKLLNIGFLSYYRDVEHYLNKC